MRTIPDGSRSTYDDQAIRRSHVEAGVRTMSSLTVAYVPSGLLVGAAGGATYVLQSAVTGALVSER